MEEEEGEAGGEEEEEGAEEEDTSGSVHSAINRVMHSSTSPAAVGLLAARVECCVIEEPQLEEKGKEGDGVRRKSLNRRKHWG